MDPFSFNQEENILNWDFSPHSFDPLPIFSPVVGPPQSDFVGYARPDNGLSSLNPNFQSDVNRNIHRRVVDFLRRIPSACRLESRRVEGSRGFRHMISERQRRERFSQSYADLHSMLPFNSKGDKISIVQSAAVYLRKLKEMKKELERRSEELEAEMIEGGEMIKVQKMNTNSSSNDSMIRALTCLKEMNVRARSIRFYFAGEELSAVMGVESKVARAEAEKALESALTEA